MAPVMDISWPHVTTRGDESRLPEQRLKILRPIGQIGQVCVEALPFQLAR